MKKYLIILISVIGFGVMPNLSFAYDHVWSFGASNVYNGYPNVLPNVPQETQYYFSCANTTSTPLESMTNGLWNLSTINDVTDPNIQNIGTNQYTFFVPPNSNQLTSLALNYHFVSGAPVGFDYCSGAIEVTDTPFPATIALTTPTSSQVLQNFQNWTVHVNELSSTTISGNSTYGVGVWYSRTSSTLQNLIIGQGSVNGSVNVDTSNIFFNDFTSTSTQCISGSNNQTSCFVYDGGNNFYLSIPKFTRLGEGTWYAIPYLQFSPLISQNSTTVRFGQPTLVNQGAMVSFVVSSTAPLPSVSTSTNLAAGLPANNATSSALAVGFGNTVQTPVFTPATTTVSFLGCLYSGVSSTFNIWNGSDWQCLIYNTIDGLKETTGNAAGSAMGFTVSTMANIFPLSIVSNFNNDISIAKANVESTTIQNVTLGNGDMDIFRGHVFTLISASTTNYLQEKTGFDWRSWAATLIYAIDGVIMMGIVVVLIRKMHHQPTA